MKQLSDNHVEALWIICFTVIMIALAITGAQS